MPVFRVEKNKSYTVIGSNRFLSNRFLSNADVWTISNFNSLSRKGFRPRFYGGWYSIIPRPDLLKYCQHLNLQEVSYER